jgi:hypothetical protein
MTETARQRARSVSAAEAESVGRAQSWCPSSLDGLEAVPTHVGPFLVRARRLIARP